MPDYAAGCPGHALIIMPDITSTVPNMHWLRDHLAPRAHVALQSKSVDVHAAAAQAGAGLATLPCSVGDGIPGLRRLDLPEPPPERELWLGFHEDLRHTLRVRTLVNYIAAEMHA